MNKNPASLIATCAALDLPAGHDVPEWVHLLPAAQGDVLTHDGRGPYRVTDPGAIIAASLHADPRDANGLIIDENHASDLAAPKGGPSPARGKIVAMEARADGIWGQIAWNASGRQLLADQAYRGISPVIVHDTQGTVKRILRASLVNYPNLRDLVALNQETPMSFMAQVAQKLGLSPDATEAEILAAIPADEPEPAMQAQLNAIGLALGVQGGDAAAILAAAQAKTNAQPEEVTALQAQLATITTELNAMRDGARREKAVAFVDGAIREGRVGVKPSRDRFIALHMSDPAGTEDMIGKMPVLGGSPTTIMPPAGQEGEVSLNAEQLAVAKATGKTPTEFAALIAADLKAKEAR